MTALVGLADASAAGWFGLLLLAYTVTLWLDLRDTGGERA
jgi:hypothetical protein